MSEKCESNNMITFENFPKNLVETVKKEQYVFSSNIFHILGIEHREVPISSYLAYLLNPRALHNQGIVFLKEFLKKDSDLQNIKDKILYKTEVYTEYLISNNRRIDILLINPEFVRIIEVKIKAKDQNSQLKDYVKDLEKKYTGVKAIYLTLDGAEPSDISRCELKKGDDYICMSFRHDVMRMLNSYALDKDVEDGRLYQFKYNFKQFKEDVKFMVGTNDDNLNKEISKFIFSSNLNYRLARGIYNYFDNPCNRENYDINDIVLCELKNLVLNVINDKSNSNALFNYIDVGDSNNAVFKYTGKYLSNDDESKDPLYFCIGKSVRTDPFCIGFVNVQDNELKNIVDEPFPILIQDNTYKNKSGFWHCWKYIPSLSGDATDPVFEDNNLNESAINVLKDGMSKYIKACLKAINQYLIFWGLCKSELKEEELADYSFPKYYE